MMKESASPYIYQQQNGKAPTQVATPGPSPANNNNRQNIHLDKHERVRRTGTHTFSMILSFVTCGAAFNIALGQVLGMLMQYVGWVERVVRVYEILWSILVIINEVQWFTVMKESPILQSYTNRGILYTFVGILGVMMNDIGMNSQWSRYGNYGSNNIVIYVPTLEHALELYLRIVSWSMVGFGLAYVVMGLMRLQGKVERHKEEYNLRLAHAGQESGKGLPLCGVMA